MKKKMLASLVALSSLSLGVVSMASGPTGAVANPTVLTEETNVGITFTNNFNPVDSQSTGTQMSLNALAYQPLIQFNSLKASVSYPWLATSETFNSTGQVVTFTISSKAYWSNGTRLTAQDVANEFNVINTNGAMNSFGVPTLARPATYSGNTVTLTFPTPEFSNATALGSELIFPVAGDPGLPASSIITSGTGTLTNNNVVGNGPYLPTTYTSQLISYTANPNWKLTPKPYVTGVNIPSYASNSNATLSLVSHQLDWAGNDIPQIQQTFVAMNPKLNHYYYPAGSTVSLWFNVGNTAPDASRDCLADPNFRYAVSHAINRSELSTLGETGFAAPATSSSGLMPSQLAYQGKYKNDLPKTGWNKTQVATYLQSKGYTIDGNNYFQVHSAAAQHATGLGLNTECSFSIQDPTGYSDYAADEQLISAELQGDRINVNTMGVTTGQWNANIFNHNFDAIIHWGSGGTSPYTQFQNWLADPALTGGSTNYGNYVNAAAQNYLVALAAAKVGSPAFQSNVNKLSNIISTQVPIAPILYGPDWDVYSTARFTGWVTPSNPYAYPGPGSNSISLVLTRLKKA